MADKTILGKTEGEKPLECGLIMPISSIDGCTADHWVDVKNIIVESIASISDLKFTTRMVSDADDVGVIQKRIVQTVYSADIVVCDVSGKNPNVMFELGMRLAFDKPTVIIKDDKTDYSFDTGVIEHIQYPRDLRFSKIVAFKTSLAAKVLATLRAAKDDPKHSMFLKHFGQFHVAALSSSSAPVDKVLVEMLTDLQADVVRLRREVAMGRRRSLIETDGLRVLAAAIKEYRALHPELGKTHEALVGDSAFIDFILARGIRRYFEDSSELIQAIPRAIGLAA